VNGFDFDVDRLRDHLAPAPGQPEREAVRSRAGELRARARRSRLLAGVAALVAVATITAGVVVATRSSEPTVTIGGGDSTTRPPTTTPTTFGPSVDNRFIPPSCCP
jgi:hypothetical protein